MSTQIQQQQVQGLVQAVADVSTLSGNLLATGQTVAGNLISTGFTLQTAINKVSGDLIGGSGLLSGRITTNLNAIYATGQLLNASISLVSGNLSTTGTTLVTRIAATGATNFTRLTTSGVALSGTIKATGDTLQSQVNTITGDLSYTSGKLDVVSGKLDVISGRLSTATGDLSYTSGKLDTFTGNVVATGSGLAGRLGENAQVASNFGLPTAPATQLFGEASVTPNSLCSERTLQWVGNVGAGTTAALYLGGSAGETAQMPLNSSWFVKLRADAKSIETYDYRFYGHTGMYALESGFVLNHETVGAPNLAKLALNGDSGSAGSGIHYGLAIGTTGSATGYLCLSGINAYTGTIRFHVTAHVSQLSTS
tara:strand:- start:1669 stop:2769 length:1101 start_codon:yes stop_codon:yes gene_type:complete